MTIIRVVWPDAADHKARILEAISWQRQHLHGRLGVGGTWAGPKNLHMDSRLLPFVTWLRARTSMNDLLLWGLVMEKGDEIRLHGHMKRIGGPNRVAGAYFLDLPSGAGQFYFGHDLGPADPPYAEGEAVIFAADIEHGVTVHHQDESRITIAWSAR